MNAVATLVKMAQPASMASMNILAPVLKDILVPIVKQV
jgi:hypothetical protein